MREVVRVERNGGQLTLPYEELPVVGASSSMSSPVVGASSSIMSSSISKPKHSGAMYMKVPMMRAVYSRTFALNLRLDRGKYYDSKYFFIGGER